MAIGCRAATVMIACGLLVSTMGCVHGHRVLKVSHARHNEAIQSRINEELLLNLVRLRYRDTPLFLQIGSVVAQFEFSASAGAAATLNEGAAGALGLQAGVAATETPTFTFTPLQDNEFVQRLLTPMDTDVIVLLQRSGWSIDRVLRLTVQQLGGLDNATSASGPTPRVAPEFEEFARVSQALRKLQTAGALVVGYEPTRTPLSAAIPAEAVQGADVVAAAQQGYRFDPASDGKSLVLSTGDKSLVLRIPEKVANRPEMQEVVRALGLDPEVLRYELVIAEAALSDLLEAPGQRRTLLIATRSLLGTLFYLSQGIDLPEEHVRAGLVTQTVNADGDRFDWSRVAGDLLRVHVQKTPPGAGAAIKVPYRGHWYYIDDADLESKSTFTLLTELFALQSGVAIGNAPVLTLPVGS